MSFKDNLIRCRELAGYSNAADFARKLGISYTTYMGYENKGAWPPEKNLLKIAELLNVSVDLLIGYKPKEEQLQDAMKLARAMDMSFTDLGSGLSRVEIQQYGRVITFTYDGFISLVNEAKERNDNEMQFLIKQSFNAIISKLILDTETKKLLKSDSNHNKMLATRINTDIFASYARQDFNPQVLAHDESVAVKRKVKRKAKKDGDK